MFICEKGRMYARLSPAGKRLDLLGTSGSCLIENGKARSFPKDYFKNNAGFESAYIGYGRGFRVICAVIRGMTGEPLACVVKGLGKAFEEEAGLTLSSEGYGGIPVFFLASEGAQGNAVGLRSAISELDEYFYWDGVETL